MKHAHYLPLLLALLLLAGCAAPAQEAVETPTPTPEVMSSTTPQPAESLPDGSPERAAVAWLTAMAENLFLYTGHDLRAGSVAELTDAERAAIPLSGVTFEAILTTSKLHGGVNFDPPYSPPPEPVMLQIADGMDYVLEKADYWAYSYKKTMSEYLNWQVAYMVQEIHTSGPFVQVIVNQGVSFRIPGVEFNSTVGTPYEVILWQNGDDWLVLDVTADDEFDGTNKWSGFNAEAAKAELDTMMSGTDATPQIIVE